MIEAFFDLPWWLRVGIAGLGFAVFWSPVGIWMTLDRIRLQNERIISLLVDIKVGRRDLP